MKQDMTIANNLRRIMYDKGITQADLARALDINKATLSCWMNGTRIPRMPNIDALAEKLMVDREDIVGKTDKPTPVKGVKIRVYGRVAAGVPLEMIEDTYDDEEIHPDMLKGGQEYFGLIIHGDSMEPKMSEGDIVIVRKQDDAETGDIVVVAINGNDATCKKLKKAVGGIWLIGLNTSFEPVWLSNDQIRSLPVTIMGKVVELRAKF